MEKITKESLILIHNRVREACLAKYDVDFDTFNIWEDGSITCYYTPRYSYADEESYSIDIEDLQPANLDKLISVRKAKEEVERLKYIEEQRIVKENREIAEKKQRKQQYLQLKKEFEDGK